MVKIKMYGTLDYDVAEQRFMIVTKSSRSAFLKWLGLHDGPDTWQDLGMLVGSTAYNKMEMLLSEHWRALLTAHFLREQKDA